MTPSTYLTGIQKKNEKSHLLPLHYTLSSVLTGGSGQVYGAQQPQRDARSDPVREHDVGTSLKEEYVQSDDGVIRNTRAERSGGGGGETLGEE